MKNYIHPTTPAPITVESFCGHRLRVRRINEDEALTDCIAAALQHPGEIMTVTRHGGTVANKYGYPAETEYVCVLAVAHAHDDVRVLRYVGRVNANKTTACACWRHATGHPLGHASLTQARAGNIKSELAQGAA